MRARVPTARRTATQASQTRQSCNIVDSRPGRTVTPHDGMPMDDPRCLDLTSASFGSISWCGMPGLGRVSLICARVLVAGRSARSWACAASWRVPRVSGLVVVASWLVGRRFGGSFAQCPVDPAWWLALSRALAARASANVGDLAGWRLLKITALLVVADRRGTGRSGRDDGGQEIVGAFPERNEFGADRHEGVADHGEHFGVIAHAAILWTALASTRTWRVEMLNIAAISR